MQHFLEAAFSVFGVLVVFSRGVGIIKSILFAEQALVKLATRPVSDRKATITNHVFDEHPYKLKECYVSACAGLA